MPLIGSAKIQLKVLGVLSKVADSRFDVYRNRQDFTVR